MASATAMRSAARSLARLLVWLGIAFAARPLLAGEAVTVQLIWKHQFEFAAFYAAEQQGYYRDAGLEVTIREGGPGIDAVREVLDGRAHFAVGTSALIVERYQGKPVVALAMLMQHSPIALLARRGQGVTSVLDLADQLVAVDAHDRDEIEAYLRASGLSPARIRLIPQTDWTLASLDRGTEAAKAVYLSNEPFLIRGREHEYLLLTPRSGGIDLFGNMLFTSEAIVRQRPELAQAFRAATLKGLVYALEHPDQIADLIISTYNTQQKSKAHLLYEAEQIRELTRPDLVEPGYMNPGRWRHVVEVYASQKKLPSDFDFAGFLYDPAPSTPPAWLVWALAGALTLMLAALVVAIRVRELNRVLRHEADERKLAETALKESEAKYRELVDNVNAIIVRINLDGTVTYFNDYAQRFFGYRTEEILGRHVLGTIVPAQESDSGRDLSRMIDAILADPVRFENNENENMTRDGRSVFVRWANRIIRDKQGRPSGVLAIGSDITLQKRAEVALREAKDAAEAANLAKSQFLATMSHEIRTPLNGILGMAQMLMMPDLTEAERQEYAAIILGSGQTLLFLLNDILDFSKIEAGRIDLEVMPFEPEHVLQEIKSLFQKPAEQKQLRLAAGWNGPDNVIYRGDTHRLRQMLSNLVGNAIKFTAQGEVRIEAREVAVAGQTALLEFSVTDTGIGIATDKQALLFRPFTQVDSSTTRQYGGTGLGLSIVRSLAEHMGGEVGVASAAGHGARFWFRIRLDRIAASHETPGVERFDSQSFAAGEPAARFTGHVLVAEDSATNHRIIEAMLLKQGLGATLVENGQQAVEHVRQGRACDLVLMDLQMPVLDGYAATQEIRLWEQDNGCTHLPIIALTADVFEENRQRCLAAGMDDFLAKPVDINKLHAVLKHWLRRPDQPEPPSRQR